MSPRKVVLAFASIAIAGSLAGPSGPLAVERRVEGGQVVFVSRPARKPGAPGVPNGPASGGSGRRGAQLAPQLVPVVQEVSRRHGLDPGLVTTVIGVESGFNHKAISPKGARGLMQLMPSTAKEYGVADPHDPRQNIEGGVAYLSDLIDRYGGDVRLALAAYNAGPEAVEKASGVPNFRETRDYLARIETRYGRLPEGGPVLQRGAPRGNPARQIRVARASDGELVATNKPRFKTRVIPKTRRSR